MTEATDIDLDQHETEVSEVERIDFEKVTSDYHLICKIGEGTFSTVYKAEDKFQHLHDKSWLESRGGDPNASYYVAIKKIYVTSSPQRIQNELDILRSLSGSENVLPMITAFRHEDQVYIVLPYFKHPDFREYFRKLPVREIRYYMRSLFLALEDVHAVGVIHRDIKPVNFLYDTRNRKGELVDFGLAERQQELGNCPCQRRSGKTTEQMLGMIHPTHARLRGVYLKDDQRSGKRANRAGTRGFRAPEVLFKCDSQFTAVDIWSAGVILLTFLSGRFPFFNANDDVEALIEISSIFGKLAMRKTAAQHNCSFEATIPTLHDRPISFSRLLHWCNDTPKKDNDEPEPRELSMAIEFMARCLTLDPWQRWTASEALQDDFLAGIESDDLLDIESGELTDVDCETDELGSAADIESPMPVRNGGVVVVEQEKVDVYHDKTSQTRSHARTRPKEFVFLKTDDVPDENLHNQMQRQYFRNLDTMKAKREASLKKTLPIIPDNAFTPRPVQHTRRQSASALNALPVARPLTPLQQILPNSPIENELNSRESRAKSHSPGKSMYDGLTTIDPRWTQL